MSFKVTKKLAGLALAAALFSFVQPGTAQAVTYGGIEFTDGAVSFADVVLSSDQLYSGGPSATAANFLNPASSLGVPDFVPNSKTGGSGAYSLGGGGMLNVGFTDNLLTNSGSSDLDLWIFEIGNMVEDTYISIHPTASTVTLLNANGISVAPDGYVAIGQIGGGTRGLDLDAYLPGFDPGVLGFNAVRLVDARSVNGVPVGTLTGSALLYAGAEIDAVGAIFTKENPGGPGDNPVEPTPHNDAVPNPEPATAAMGLMGLAGLALKLGRRTRKA
ncbi:MAG: hypothetical protein K8S99_07555 [Planctomycetes bacterium]|nr:hypothetical protein [Planctomycetota bacterium]